MKRNTDKQRLDWIQSNGTEGTGWRVSQYGDIYRSHDESTDDDPIFYSLRNAIDAAMKEVK